MNISGVKGTGILNETSYLNSKWSKYLSKTKKASLFRIKYIFFKLLAYLDYVAKQEMMPNTLNLILCLKTLAI